MRKIISLSIAFMLLFFFADFASARSYRTSTSDVSVKGYYRSNGTYVKPHFRSAPNNSILDNYSCIDNGRCGGSSSNSNSSYLYTPTYNNTSVSQEDIGKANRSYAAGQKLFVEKNYSEALSSFKSAYSWNPTEQLKKAMMDTYTILISQAYTDKQHGKLLSYINEAEKIASRDLLTAYKALSYLNNGNCETFSIYIKQMSGTINNDKITNAIQDGVATCKAQEESKAQNTTIIINPLNSKAMRKKKNAEIYYQTKMMGLPK